MADQNKSPANGHHRSDEESGTLQSKELKRKKRIRLSIYISVFVVIQIIVITTLALIALRVKTPEVRLRAVHVQTLKAAPATPSFDMTFTTQIRIRNKNFGPYKFDATNATFAYEDRTVGRVIIPKSKVGMRSTKKIDVTVSLNSKGLPRRPNLRNLGNELSTGVLTLYSDARLTGKVELLSVKKTKRSARMRCTLGFNLSTKKIQYLQCYHGGSTSDMF